jgi:hypothetical protein
VNEVHGQGCRLSASAQAASSVGDAKHKPQTVFNDKSAILVLRISGDCQ